MEPPRVDMERFDVAVKSMTKMDISKETAERVLNKLLKLYEYNWEHIEADNYETLAHAILDDSDSNEKKKKRAEKKNLDSETCNKKLKVKEHGQKPKSNFYSNGNKELSEVPRQQGAEALVGKSIRTRSQPSSQNFLKEPKKETNLRDDRTIGESSSALLLGSQDNHNYETPLAVMSPQVLEPGRRKEAALQHLTTQKSKGVPGSHEGHVADARKSKAIVCSKDYSTNFEVFLTPGGKGWGLRTAEKLPPGAFVCEYAGEVLTNIELHERIVQKTGNGKHTYPLNLDADWGTEGVLKDDEALSLDATFYGNVARFINHRCFDGNLMGIPVEIETPDHHYYHLAFFTKRQVEPLEELTWDYEIDFDDVDHPIKAFKCCCGSEYCRDKNRISRGSRSEFLHSRGSRQ